MALLILLNTKQNYSDNKEEGESVKYLNGGPLYLL